MQAGKKSSPLQLLLVGFQTRDFWLLPVAALLYPHQSAITRHFGVREGVDLNY
jgi:hypothetical protein